MFKKIFYKLEYQIRLHTSFSKKETRGALVLLFLMLLSMILPQYYRFITLKEEPLTMDEKKTLDSLFRLIANDQQNLSQKKYSYPYTSKEKYISHKKNVSKKIFLNLNNSDSLTLLQLPGIGPVLAGRIIRFREKLGGFINKEQLNSVYGIRPETYAQVSSMIFVAQDFIPEKIKINEADYNILSQHPFIGKKLAYQIVKYRKTSKISGLEFLGDDIKNKLRPYIEY